MNIAEPIRNFYGVGSCSVEGFFESFQENNKHTAGVILDVQSTQDGELIVYPGGKLIHNGEQSFFVKYLTSLNVVDLRLKSKFVEELSTVFDSVLSKKKFGSDFVFCLRVMDDITLMAIRDFLSEKIKSGCSASSFMISSSNQVLLARAQNIIPDVAIAVQLDGVPYDYAECINYCRAAELHITEDALSEHLIRDAKHRGVNVRFVGVWTGSLAFLSGLGVDNFGLKYNQ
jgi:glycerophosphoryl diester phosphodiesterase